MNERRKSEIPKLLAELERREKTLLEKEEKPGRFKEALYKKVPAPLRSTLESAFSKAFEVVFLKGAGVIEKTFDKESVELEYEAGDYVVSRHASRKSVRRLDKGAGKGSLLNGVATAASGVGLGLLGLGLPDIPLMVGTLLKGIYEIALGYGFSYAEPPEQVYVLRLIRTALAGGEEKRRCNELLEQGPQKADRTWEIEQTAKALSDALLVEKFIQGIPVIGAIGGVVNGLLYQRVSALAKIKYKKRYLLKKQKEGVPERDGIGK